MSINCAAYKVRNKKGNQIIVLKLEKKIFLFLSRRFRVSFVKFRVLLYEPIRVQNAI
jgi:hypothetical protein